MPPWPTPSPKWVTRTIRGGPVAIPTGAGSVRQVDSYIVHPNTVRSLGRGRAAVIGIQQPTGHGDRARLTQIVEYGRGADGKQAALCARGGHSRPRGVLDGAPRPLAGQVAANRMRQRALAALGEPGTTIEAGIAADAAPHWSGGGEGWPEPDPRTEPIEVDDAWSFFDTESELVTVAVADEPGLANATSRGPTSPW